jgi:hypothetical protein
MMLLTMSILLCVKYAVQKCITVSSMHTDMKSNLEDLDCVVRVWTILEVPDRSTNFLFFLPYPYEYIFLLQLEKNLIFAMLMNHS